MIDSIKKAFILSVKALKLFYLVAAVNIVINVINVLIIPAPVDKEMSAGQSFGIIGLTLLFALIGVFIYGGVLAYIRELIKTGAGNLSSFLANAKKYFAKVLALTVLIFLIYVILAIIASVILGVLPQGMKGPFAVLIVLFFIALTVLLLMAPYALIGSEMGIVESLKRGVRLGKNNFLKILGILALIALIGIAVMIAASLLSGILSFLLKPLATYIAAIVMAVAGGVLAILVNIAYMDYYLKF